MGTILGGFKLLFGRFPSKVITSYTSNTFKEKVDIGDIYLIPRVIARAMIADKRLSPEWDNEDNLMPPGSL